jgi:hypothetical protein
VVLHLRQVQVQAEALVVQPAGVVECVQPEVDQRAGDRLALDPQVLLRQVPAARAHEQRRGLLGQLVALALRAVVADRAVDRVDQVHVPLDLVLPRR